MGSYKVVGSRAYVTGLGFLARSVVAMWKLPEILSAEGCSSNWSRRSSLKPPGWLERDLAYPCITISASLLSKSFLSLDLSIEKAK